MAEYIAVEPQTVNPGETVVFYNTAATTRRQLVLHRDGTGVFTLRGYVPRQGGCPCKQPDSASYLAAFGANIAIPTGGTVGAISLALAVDGTTIPASTMTVTPAAVEQFFNVSREINALVWRGCCQSLSIRNTSDQPILVSAANLVISRPDLR